MDGLARKVLLGVTVGLGMVASSAALYVLFNQDDEDPILKDYRIQTSRQTTIRVRIPKDVIGAVIGRGGENVKRIQKETKTRINFEDDKVENAKYAIIKGDPDTVAEAERIINLIINEQPVFFVEEIKIAYNAVGIVIGRGGDTIRHICDTSGAKITVARTPGPDGLTPVTIKGSADQVSTARSMIEEKVAENDIRMNRYSTSASSSKANNLRYKGRALAIESVKNDPFDENDDRMTEELIETLENGFLEIYVSAVESPYRFWVQVFGTKGIQLDRLSDDMTDFYEIEENRTSTQLSSINVGDIVAAPYTLDENYYRVRVLSIDEDTYTPDETLVRVFYLDFGDEATHQRKSLCLLRDDFLNALPFQAVECRLNGVQPQNSVEWSEDAIKFFSESVYSAQWTQILARPVRKVSSSSGKGSVYIVDLVDVKNKPSDANIADALIEEGFATRVVEENGH